MSGTAPAASDPALLEGVRPPHADADTSARIDTTQAGRMATANRTAATSARAAEGCAIA